LSDKDQKKQIPLRLSQKLWNDLAAWASDEFRSVNGQIEFLLTECVRRRGHSAIKPDKRGAGEHDMNMPDAGGADEYSMGKLDEGGADINQIVNENSGSNLT
jgi:hypothetical protein